MYRAKEIGFVYDSLELWTIHGEESCGKVLQRVGRLARVCSRRADFVVVFQDDEGEQIAHFGCRKHALRHWGALWMQTPAAN